MTPEQPTDPNSPKSTPTQDQPTAAGAGPGKSTVNAVGIILISAYVVIEVLLSGYLLIKVWPHCTGVPIPPLTHTNQTGNSNRPLAAANQNGNRPSGPAPGESEQPPQPQSPNLAATSEPQCKNPTWIEFFWGGYWIWEEVRLLLIVIIAGILGALLHIIRSLFWYVGNRDFRSSWVLMYILLPFAGALLALAFYFLIRGGFFPQANANEGNPIGFAALAFLIGLFSAQAGLKLKQVFETVFSAAPPGANARPQTPVTPAPATPGASAPKISGISTDKGATSGGTSLTISGANFSEGVAVFFGALPAKAVTLVNATTITALTPPASSAGKVDVKVTNKDGQSATLPQAYTYE